MYGLQTAPSPRRTNCKIHRNIEYKEDNFGGGGEILDENLNWNSHNNSHLTLILTLTLTLTLTPTLTLHPYPFLGVTLTLVLATRRKIQQFEQ